MCILGMKGWWRFKASIHHHNGKVLIKTMKCGVVGKIISILEKNPNIIHCYPSFQQVKTALYMYNICDFIFYFRTCSFIIFVKFANCNKWIWGLASTTASLCLE